MVLHFLIEEMEKDKYFSKYKIYDELLEHYKYMSLGHFRGWKNLKLDEVLIDQKDCERFLALLQNVKLILLAYGEFFPEEFWKNYPWDDSFLRSKIPEKTDETLEALVRLEELIQPLNS